MFLNINSFFTILTHLNRRQYEDQFTIKLTDDIFDEENKVLRKI